MAGEQIPDVFTAPASELTEPVVRTFVTDAMAARRQAESLVLEFKRQNNDKNVVLAVAAMSNTDGGLVIVGVDEKAASADPFVGIPAPGVDALVQQLRALVPTSMPEVIPLALSDKPGRVLLILRIDADQVERPVVVDGRVMKRVPGQSVGARRDEVVALASPDGDQVRSASTIPWDPARMRTWDGDASPHELRVASEHLLPRHVSSLRYLGTPGIEAAHNALAQGTDPDAHLCTAPP